MPTPMPTGLKLGLVEPKDAIAAFEKRGLLQPSFRWQDVWQDEHARAFAVAGVQRLDVLQVFKDEVEKAVSEGKSLKDFQDALIPQLVTKGFWGDVEITDADTGETRIGKFNERRLQTIYDVNVRQSFAAGRWQRIQATKKQMPFIVYWTMQDEHVRASHRAWNGIALPVDDPWWDTHYPPNGWNCRCYAHSINQKGLDRLKQAGVAIKTTAPPDDPITYVNPRTGEIAPIPRGIDPGFAYNPGKQRDEALYDASLRKAISSYPLAAATALAQAQADMPAFVASATRSFGTFVDQVLETGHGSGQVRFIGALGPGAVRGLSNQGIDVASAVIAVRDDDVLHALRDAKVAEAVAAPLSWYRRLPELLTRASAVLLDQTKGDNSLLYVVDADVGNGKVAKIVVRLEYWIKMKIGDKRQRVPMNLVRTVTVINPDALQDSKSYQLLWGTLK